MPLLVLTIVITTHNRVGKLENCLNALRASEHQELISDIVVVDDGSRDETPRFLAAAKEQGQIATVVRNETSRGPAAARNQGIQFARAAYTLITGDDVRFFPDAIARFCEHIKQHALSNASVLGNIMPVPEDITAFEHWLCNGGSQFGHSRIPKDKIFDAGENYYYTCNVVTPTDLLREHPFDESFPFARYEDIELSYRLKRAVNHKIHYLESAKSYHDHRYKFRSWLQDFEKFTWAALHFSRLHPDDLDLRKRLGINRAEETTTFSFDYLMKAAELLNEFHTEYFETESFGSQWRREWVASGFRIIQEFFRMSFYRRHLGLPAMCDPETVITADEAMGQLLIEIDDAV